MRKQESLALLYHGKYQEEQKKHDQINKDLKEFLELLTTFETTDEVI